MADANEGHDRLERMRGIEPMDRDIMALRDSLVQQTENVDRLPVALRALIDRIPPENLRP